MYWIHQAIMDILEEDIEAKIFQDIAENGPISVYAASDKKDRVKPPYGTVHRHFKNLESENLITIYKKEMHQNKKYKYLYGPTLSGVAEFYFSEKGRMIKDIKPVFQKWRNSKKFIEDENGKEFFDFNEFQFAPQKHIEIYKKWVEFVKKADDYKEIPEELELDVGMMILGKKEPKYFLETLLELYGNMPNFKREVDLYFQNLISVYQSIKKIQQDPVHPTNITARLLLKYWPMMSPKEMKKIQRSKEPKFNVEFFPHDNKKEIEFKNTTLTELYHNTFDNLLKNYEMHVSKPDASKLSDSEIKYIMAYCAYNMAEVDYALSFEELYESEWYGDEPEPKPQIDAFVVMLNPYSDHSGPITSQFYDNFEIFVPNMDEIAPEIRGVDDWHLGIDDDKIEAKIEEKRKLAEKRWKIRRNQMME